MFDDYHEQNIFLTGLFFYSDKQIDTFFELDNMTKSLHIPVSVPEVYEVYVNRWTGLSNFLFKMFYDAIGLAGVEQSEVNDAFGNIFNARYNQYDTTVNICAPK